MSKAKKAAALEKATEYAARLGVDTDDLAVSLFRTPAGKARSYPVGETTYLFSARLDDTFTVREVTGMPTTVEPEEKKTQKDAGETEMYWAGQVVKHFAVQYRMVAIEHSDSRVMHRIDPHTREISPTNIDTVSAEMRAWLGENMTLKSATAVVRRALDMLSTDAAYLVREISIAPLLFDDQEPSRFTYRRLPFTRAPLHVAPPPFMDLLARMDAEGAVATTLYIGSFMDADSSRKQYLVLYGPGNNGKSSLFDALIAVFKAAAVTMSASDFLNRFGMGDAATARLVIFDDNNNASFMTSGDFKRITGSATLRVERKGKDSYRARNNLKILIACNQLPKLDGNMADFSRNLLVRMAPYVKDDGSPAQNTHWVRQLHEAMPDVLRYCYTKWMEHRAAGGTDIPAPAVAKEEVYNASIEAQAEDFIREYLVETSDGKLRPEQVHALATGPAKLAPKVYDYLKHHLNEKYRMKRDLLKGQPQHRYYPGVTLRERTSTDI